MSRYAGSYSRFFVCLSCLGLPHCPPAALDYKSLKFLIEEDRDMLCSGQEAQPTTAVWQHALDDAEVEIRNQVS